MLYPFKTATRLTTPTPKSLNKTLLPAATKLWSRLCFYSCLILLTGEGCAIPACIAGGIPACLAAGLQRGCAIPTCIAGGIPACLAAGLKGCYPSMSCSRSPGGVPGLGGESLLLGGLLLWWPSGLVALWFKMTFWFVDLLVESGLLI